MADEKMQNENKKSLNTREDNVAEDIRREAAGKDAEMAADKTTEKEGAPKKKNLAFVVRPQNSKNSSRLQGKRPGQGRQGQNQGRPNGDGKRPAAGQSRSNGEGKPARTEKPDPQWLPAPKQRLLFWRPSLWQSVPASVPDPARR